MIERYTRPAMGALWSDEHRFRTWLAVEIAACEAHHELGNIPAEALAHIKERATFTVARVLEIEQETNHDMIAFLTNVAEYVGESSRFIHMGLTSSDVLDTALALQMKQAGTMLLEMMHNLSSVLARRAVEFKNTICIGRTHGIHAEPTTFGLKLALWYEETKRNTTRLERAVETISFGKISGAVGTFEHLPPAVEEIVCQRLGLQADPVSTQIIQRDRHAEFMTTLAIIASSLEKFATEIRHLQKTEVLEAEEFFAAGQKGSSAMPHKRNPITCERIAGLARVLRGNAMAALENVSLWHERDITHSSVERVIIPDSTILLDYVLHLMTRVVDKLLVYPEQMRRNINLTYGLVFSQRVLLALVASGMLREDAYKIVQRNAMEVWKSRDSFREVLGRDADILAALSGAALDSCFEESQAVRHVDTIFKRCGL
jgi:adenylosuccinate lyase